MNRIIITVLLIIISGDVLAGWSTSTGEVTRVYSHNGAHVIRTTLTDDICSAGNFWWPADDSDAPDMFALALAALTANKKVQVVYSPTTPDCRHGESAKISHIVIIK